MKGGTERPPTFGVRSRVLAALTISIFLVFGLGGWAATAKLSGAVIASGVLVVEGSVKKVQHPTGGIVGKIYVHNGSRVAAGDVLMELDDTQTKASLGVIQSQLTDLTGRRARLAAERDGAQQITFPPEFRRTGDEAKVVASGEERLFNAKRHLIESQKAQLNERIGQLHEKIRGLTAQLEAKARELKLVRAELKRVTDMFERELTPITRVLAMQREEARIAGEHGSLIADIASAKGQITETEMQSLSLDRTVQSDAQKELRDVEARIAELKERKIAAVDQLKRVVIRAPRSGVVHELTVHTIGGVISAGDQIMLIVPTRDHLAIEARVSPTDIDQITIGQKTMLRFSAFNQRVTPEIPGHVTRVAADLSKDPQSGQSYYLIRIAADATALKAARLPPLVPGMPVESFIQTHERTALSFIVKPLQDQFMRVFREQ